MRILDGKDANSGDPRSIQYMPSIKNHGNKYYNEFIDHKTSAMKDLAMKGEASKEYQSYINHPPKMIKPSGIKLFPMLGMLSNK